MFRRSYSYRVTPDPDAPLRAMLFRVLINALGLWLASVIVPGVYIGDWQSLVVGTALFAIINTLVKPVVTMLSCFFVVVTFGVFLLVINAAMLALAAWAAGELGMNFRVDGFWSALFGSIVISLVSMAAALFTPSRR